MYVGMGQVSTTDLSSVSSAIAGTAAPQSCSFGYTYDAGSGGCVAPTCSLGYTFDPDSGVCVGLSWASIQAWLGQGSNALYAVGGVLAAVFLGIMIAK